MFIQFTNLEKGDEKSQKIPIGLHLFPKGPSIGFVSDCVVQHSCHCREEAFRLQTRMKCGRKWPPALLLSYFCIRPILDSC